MQAQTRLVCVCVCPRGHCLQVPRPLCEGHCIQTVSVLLLPPVHVRPNHGLARFKNQPNRLVAAHLLLLLTTMRKGGKDAGPAWPTSAVRVLCKHAERRCSCNQCLLQTHTSLMRLVHEEQPLRSCLLWGRSARWPKLHYHKPHSTVLAMTV